MPKQVDHDKRRLAFAAAAYRVIARRGLAGATVREIAKEAGFTTGALVHYFPSKDEILIRASEYGALIVRKRMEKHAQTRTGLEALRHVLFESLPLTAEMRGNWNVWLGFWDRSTHSAAIHKLTRERYAEWIGRIAGLIDQAKSIGELPAELDAEVAAQAIVALVDGIGVRVLLTGISITQARQKQMVDACLNLLSRPQSATPARTRVKPRRTDPDSMIH